MNTLLLNDPHNPRSELMAMMTGGFATIAGPGPLVVAAQEVVVGAERQEGEAPAEGVIDVVGGARARHRRSPAGGGEERRNP